MDRRTLLGRTGTLLAAGAFAGCLSRTSGGADDPDANQGRRTKRTSDPTTNDSTTRTTDGSSETTVADDGPFEFDPGPDAPFETASVGDREGVFDPPNNRPHAVRVWNAAGAEREIRLAARRDGRVALDRAFAFPADGYLELTLNVPGDHALAVSIEGERAGTVEIGRSHFDCNASTTDVAVTADGGVEHRTVSTEIACPPRVTRERFEVVDRGCAGDEREAARVTFEDGAVAVEGTVRAPTPCHGAALNRVGHGFDGALTAFVDVVDPVGKGGCAQCVGALDYEARLGFEGDLPAEVTVVHATGDEETAVTTATRGGRTTATGTTARGTTTDAG